MTMKATSTEQIRSVISAFDQLPDAAFVRCPVVAGLLSLSEASVWRLSKIGTLPRPHKVGPNITGWNVGELRRVLAMRGS